METIGQPVTAKDEERPPMLPYSDVTARPKMTELPCTQPMSFNFPFAHFALMYINRHGELQVEASPSIAGYEKGIFTEDVREKFLKSATVGWQPNMQSGTVGHMDNDITGKQQAFLANPTAQIGLQQSSGSWYQPQSGLIPCEWQSFQNKRHRRNMRRVGSAYGQDSDSISPTPSLRWSALRVGNQELLRTYYDKAFENFQQLNCRAIAKAFVKLVEPRKQVNHPYNGRKTTGGSSQRVDPELTKPKWWPAGVTHREPDHLLKAVPAERSQVLDEIYYVREMEEMYLDGKISGDTVIHVSHVHMGEACVASELQAQVTDSSFCDPSLATSSMKRNVSNIVDNQYHGIGHEAPQSSFEGGHATMANYQTKQSNAQDTHPPLSPASSPSISRKSSLESSLTTYSDDIHPGVLAPSDQNRGLCEPKDVNPGGVSCLPEYFTQHMATQTTTQHHNAGFWNPLPHAHQPLAFPGY
ncbi:conserved hypothetical protein [Aspergillus terreus NIH2624]|uniref:Subtelomeric hrmA-associated cluster protein AFUB-079030/YDR124W-like helical bundle domain-containing protein n=1 Tax=Aspergillus terreus (strain NIH 2624 / FGSC A1156) TaxID=341663 RepID=Q0CXD9_ASPTN|nr:uncharacterized protein ATEG_01645 [Aspergillus terreus NIH2624]EAU38402.1 conserved hypothetical protein [Aspergillus terreus NIH2624]